jgi:tetratricopeptide (TPR) repeat protein
LQTVSTARPPYAERLFSLAILAHQNGQYEMAAGHYQQLLRLNPAHACAHGNLGVAFAARGKLREAVVHYERALALDPDYANAHNNLGSALSALGRTTEAVAHYQRAVALKPDHADLHNNLGLALSAQGRIAEAICAYSRAVTLNPGHARAHNNLGVALASQGRIAEAIAQYRQAIALMPAYADAYNNLGAALSVKGRFAEAVPAYERALAINPNNTNVHANLGAALADLGQLGDAAMHIKKALALNPRHAEAQNTIGNICTNQGEFGEAIEHFGQAIAIKPDYAEAHLNRAQVKFFHRGDSELAALEELAANRDLSPKKAVFIHFALAKALEDTADYVRAFEQLRKGNALKRAQTDYQEATVLRQFPRIPAVFSRGLFDHFRGAGDFSTTPVFILGMPRSGSTLVEQILASHPLVHGAGELLDFEAVTKSVIQAAKPALPYPECVPTLDAATFRRIGQAYLARLAALSDGKVRIVDKLPGNFLNIGLIHLALPNARIIHAVRHPAATCLSCYSKLFTSGNPYAYDLGELGRFYRHYQGLMAHWRSILPPNAMLEVVYEGVIEDLEGEARRLIDYCGLPWDDHCLSFHTTNRTVRTASAVQVRKPLFRGSLERWRNYQSELAPLLNQLRLSDGTGAELPVSA